MLERPDYTRTKWNGWGAPEKSFSFYERQGLETYFTQKLGVYQSYPDPGLTLDEISLPPSRLTDAARIDLVAMAGSENVVQDIEVRASHSVGKSYEDLIRARRGELSNPPDAVVYPESAASVREILSWAATHNVAVIPFGGGTGVVGGIEALRAAGQELAVVLDLRRMAKILFVDTVSQTAKIEPGIRGPVLEGSLQAQGLTLGHYPQSFEYSALGGWIATRSTGQYAGYYGKIEDMVLGLSVETPVGSLESHGVPARSAGPELRELLIGSEGCLGLVTLAELRLRPNPEIKTTLAFLMPDFEQGVLAIRELVQRGFPLAMVRLSDEDDTEMMLALQTRAAGLGEQLRRGLGRVILDRRGMKRPCLLLTSLHGTKRRVEKQIQELSGFLEARTGYDMGEAAARAFHRDYFVFPYLRDALMDLGVLVEMLETAVSWGGLQRLYISVRKTVSKACEEIGSRSSVNCHISHVYPSGAALSFLVLASVGRGDELRLSHACRRAATEAIIRAGGALSHHHGIGVAYRDWMMQEHGPVGVSLLRSLKAALDPAGILNPGKLIP